VQKDFRLSISSVTTIGPTTPTSNKFKVAAQSPEYDRPDGRHEFRESETWGARGYSPPATTKWSILSIILII
jgi:hypothetical protein